MSKPLTITQFFQQFPDDDACLDHLMAFVTHAESARSAASTPCSYPRNRPSS